jgi:hypothetical protein
MYVSKKTFLITACIHKRFILALLNGFNLGLVLALLHLWQPWQNTLSLELSNHNWTHFLVFFPNFSLYLGKLSSKFWAILRVCKSIWKKFWVMLIWKKLSMLILAWENVNDFTMQCITKVQFWTITLCNVILKF